MLNEEKIKLMTKVTIYEKNEEFDGLALSQFYKEDYVKYGCLKTLVATTFAYWLCVAVYGVINFEKILGDLNHVDYFKMIRMLMIGYVSVMALFYIYAFIVYNYKYSKKRKGLVRYNRMLKKLIKLYEADESHQDVLSGKVKVYSGIGGDFEDDYLTPPEQKTDMLIQEERSLENGVDTQAEEFNS